MYKFVVLVELKWHSYDDQFGTSYATPTGAYANNRRPAANIQTHRDDLVGVQPLRSTCHFGTRTEVDVQFGSR